MFFDVELSLLLLFYRYNLYLITLALSRHNSSTHDSTGKINIVVYDIVIYLIKNDQIENE